MPRKQDRRFNTIIWTVLIDHLTQTEVWESQLCRKAIMSVVFLIQIRHAIKYRPIALIDFTSDLCCDKWLSHKKKRRKLVTPFNSLKNSSAITQNFHFLRHWEEYFWTSWLTELFLQNEMKNRRLNFGVKQLLITVIGISMYTRFVNCQLGSLSVAELGQFLQQSNQLAKLWNLTNLG